MALGIPIALPFRVHRAAFDPGTLFRNGEQGGWYDPSDMSTLFQDAAGTTPVTALEQPVGLILDKSRGLVLGPELRATGVTALIGTATAASYNTGTGAATVHRGIDGDNQSFIRFSGLDAALTYVVSITAVSGTATGVAVRAGGPTGFIFGTVGNGASGSVIVAQPAGGVITLTTSGANNINTSFTIVSFQTLAGNHLRQTTGTSRPVLSARENLLVSTEDFANAAWAKSGATVTANADGTSAKIVRTAGTVGLGGIVQVSGNRAGAFSVSARVKAAGYNFVSVTIANNVGRGVFSLATNTYTNYGGAATGSVVDDTDGYKIIKLMFANAAGGGPGELHLSPVNANIDPVASWTSDGTSGIFVTWVQTERSPAPTRYQRVNTATDYDTEGFPRYLAFDGVDDFLTIGTFNMSASDKVTVCAGLRKISATTAVAVELSAQSTTNNGAFGIFAPDSAAQYTFASRGTLLAFASTVDAQFAAPHTGVVTGTGDIAADGCRLAIGGIQRGITGSDQGTGNYGAAYPLFVGRRGGTTLPFNGNLHGLVIRGTEATTTQIAALERYMAQKTGISA